MRVSTLMMVFLLMLPGLAKEQLLMTATNDQDKKIDKLSLKFDSEGVPTHLLHSRTGEKTTSYTAESLTEGVVLKRKSGKDLLLLKVLSFDAKKGGAMELKYLYRGVPSMEYRSLKLALKKHKEKWSVHTKDVRDPVKSLVFQANMATLFGRQTAVGIASIKVVH